MGVLFAFIAFVSWGLGDFLIQKSARKFGNQIAVFYITAFASLVLLPFVFRDITSIFFTLESLPFLLFASVVVVFATLFDFEALRVGKLSVVEPVYALEVPIATMLAASFVHERLRVVQYALIVAVLLGIMLVSARSKQSFRLRLEKGVVYAFIATVCMGTVNFLFGVGVRSTGPLLINWFTSTFLAVIIGVSLLWQSRFGEVVNFWKRSKKLILGVSVFDNLAWIAFATSMLYIPIGVATGISESYVALAAALGIVFNRERLKHHQWLGFAICSVSAVALALVTDK